MVLRGQWLPSPLSPLRHTAISTLEQHNCGSMMTSSGINLSSSRAAKQRARNTGPFGLLGVSLLAADATGDSGIGTGSVIDGGQPNRVVGCSGGTRYHSVYSCGVEAITH